MDKSLIKKLISLYITCRTDKTGTNKINPSYSEDLSSLGYIKIKFYSKENSEFFVFEDTFSKYFIFMGSNEIKDWFYNFLFSKSEIPYEGVNPKIKVHDGFLQMYKKVREEVLKQAKTNKQIIIYGHSLGSAIATLAAVDVQYHKNNNIECLLTGTPRVGNKYFKKSYNNRVPFTTRIVKGNDIVSKIPFSFFGFRHVSNNYIHIGSRLSWKVIIDHNLVDYEKFL